jgi:hypothetical protein
MKTRKVHVHILPFHVQWLAIEHNNHLICYSGISLNNFCIHTLLKVMSMLNFSKKGTSV